MTANGEHGQRPLELPRGWDMQNNVADIVCAQFGMRQLTEAEVATVESGDVFINDAGIQRFQSWKEFKNPSNQNNFWRVFAGTPNDFDYVVWHRTLSFQRFEILHPDLTERLSGIKRGQFEAMDDGYEQLLYVAYNALADLTDVNDPEISTLADPESKARYWQG